MEIATHIIEEAKTLLSKGVLLPVEIKSAPGFFLAVHDDSYIFAMSAITHNDTFYKIGVKKNSEKH